MQPIAPGIYQVGGSELTDGRDASAYLVADAGEAVLIDTGAGVRPERVLARIAEAGVTPAAVTKIILTHSHIDHTGGAAWLARELGAEIVAHARCADILAIGDDPRTSASWYDLSLPPLVVDQTFSGGEQHVPVGGLDLVCLYTPGHSPCSVSIFVDLPGAAPAAAADPAADPPRPAGALRVLFGQDVHGPIHPALESDRGLYQKSLARLLALRVDVLCEGHFGVYRPAAEVREYIRSYLE